mgnify:CR=1 FL=1
MKKLILISALLLFGSNGWTNEAFDNCIAIAEEAKNNVLEPTDWSEIEDAIELQVQAAAESARLSPNVANINPWAIIGERKRAEDAARAKYTRELEDLKREEQSRISESKRDATKDYIELLKVCADLNVIKFEGEIELKE